MPTVRDTSITIDEYGFRRPRRRHPARPHRGGIDGRHHGRVLRLLPLRHRCGVAVPAAVLSQEHSNHRIAASLATFGLAFVARPVGSMLFGHFGDRVGRKAKPWWPHCC